MTKKKKNTLSREHSNLSREHDSLTHEHSDISQKLSHGHELLSKTAGDTLQTVVYLKEQSIEAKARQDMLMKQGLDTEAMIRSIRAMAEQIQKLTQEYQMLMRENQSLKSDNQRLYGILQGRKSRNRTETIEYNEEEER